MAAVNSERGIFEIITISSDDEDEKKPSPKSPQPSTSFQCQRPRHFTQTRLDMFAPSSSNCMRMNGNSTIKTESKHVVPFGPEAEVEDHLTYFISEMSPLMNGEEESSIVLRIRPLTSKCNSAFVNSRRFKELVRTCVTNSLRDKSNVFQYMKDLYDTLKAYRKSKELVRTNCEASASVPVPTVNGCASSDHGDSAGPSDVEKERAVAKHIKSLEKLLGKLDRRIRLLQEKELDFDAMDSEDSTYVTEDKFKKRFVRVWNKLCELKGRSCSTGRHVEKKIRYEGTRYPEINKQIEKLANHKKRVFPDFCDINKVVEETNEKEGLFLPPTELRQLSIQVFEDVGKVLKRRRESDERDLFGSYLTDAIDEMEDPVEKDPLLKEQLEKNDRIASTIDDVIERYVAKANEMKLLPEEVPDENGDISSGPEEEDRVKGDNEIDSEESSDASKEATNAVPSEPSSPSSNADDLELGTSSRSTKPATSNFPVALTYNPPKRIKLDVDKCVTLDSSQEVIVLD